MSTEITRFGKEPDFFVVCYRRVRMAWQGRCGCRECGSKCSFLSNVCETCGTQDPIRLPFAWAIFALGLCAAVLLVRCVV